MIRKFQILVFSSVLVFFSCVNEPYEGPINSGFQISCEEASANLTSAEVNFEDVNASNYTSYCQDYREALENYILACSDNSDEISTLLSQLGDCELTSYFQVDFDNATFFAHSAEAFINQGMVSIKGIRGIEEEAVELIVIAPDLGTYPLGINTNNGLVNIGQYSPNNTNLNAWQSVNSSTQPLGEITITEIDYLNSVLSGTFSFTAYNEDNEIKVFTNGIFENIRFTKADDFFAKVDGVEFVDVDIVPGINNFGWVGFLARGTQNEEIFLAVRYNASPGTYNLNQDSSFTNFDYSPSFQDFHYGDGTVTIEFHDPESNLLMGTFSCTALPELGGVGTYEISEGRFCVTYLDGSFDED